MQSLTSFFLTVTQLHACVFAHVHQQSRDHYRMVVSSVVNKDKILKLTATIPNHSPFYCIILYKVINVVMVMPRTGQLQFSLKLFGICFQITWYLVYMAIIIFNNFSQIKNTANTPKEHPANCPLRWRLSNGLKVHLS